MLKPRHVTDEQIVAGLAAAHRSKSIIPGGTLPRCISIVETMLLRTLGALQTATSDGVALEADRALVVREAPSYAPAETAAALATIDRLLAENLTYRDALLQDIARRRRHLAELEEAQLRVRFEDSPVHERFDPQRDLIYSRIAGRMGLSA